MPKAPRNDTTTRLATGLAKLALVLRHERWRRAGERHLTPTQQQALATIASRPDEAPGLKEVAAQLALTLGAASEAISALERKKLLRKERSSRDGRAIALRLTLAGRREAERVREWPEALLESIDALDAEEQAAMARSLTKMIHALQERGHVPMARMCVNCAHFRPRAHRDAARPHHCAFLDAPIGDADLRLDCPDMTAAPDGERNRLWTLFVEGNPVESPPA